MSKYSGPLLKLGNGGMGPWYVNVKRLRTIGTDIYKTLKCSNGSFMKEMFALGETNRLLRDYLKLGLNLPNTISYFWKKKLQSFWT